VRAKTREGGEDKRPFPLRFLRFFAVFAATAKSELGERRCVETGGLIRPMRIAEMDAPPGDDVVCNRDQTAWSGFFGAGFRNEAKIVGAGDSESKLWCALQSWRRLV